jgi:hypothetical protein
MISASDIEDNIYQLGDDVNIMSWQLKQRGIFTRASSCRTPFCNARVMSDAMCVACVFWYLNAYKIRRRSLFRGETLLSVMKA